MLKKNTQSILFAHLKMKSDPSCISNYLFIVSAHSRFKTNAGQNNCYTKKKKEKYSKTVISIMSK